MSITTSCAECEQKMVDGVFKHSKTCSANNFIPEVGTGMTPPAVKLTFDTPEEQKRFMDSLGTSGSKPKKKAE